ncbi:organic solute carrier partner 1 isoform X2 [Megachile rotundata]|uniref:organic solute carrier partner 1 isoform X2 n=1 Tax=Megachile rotundata TaxID=143995 RepID=UPI000258F840
MSLCATPILYLNMGGEMLYVLRQRLKAQRINVDKTIQVLDDVTAALLNPKILSCIFEEKPLTGIPVLRSTLECVVLSSIMKLDKNSMNKLFDLMIMMVKYQLTVATGPIEVILLTLNHTDAMRDMVSHPNAQQCVGLIHQMVVDFYGSLTFEEIWNARNTCLKELEPYRVRVSVLLRLGLQNDDGTFNITNHKYDEKYEENKDHLSRSKICDVDLKTYCNGSFNLFGERDTLLGKNMYAMTHDISKLTSEQENDNYLKDCGTRAELGMLAVQLGTEETSYKRPFSLNLLSNEDNNNANVEKEEGNSKEDGEDNTTIIKQEKTKFNEDYKIKLDNIRADFFEDEPEGINHNMDLLELLDKAE